jgi:hypothetical protein
MELEEEEVQRVQEAELRRRCVAVSLLQDYMTVPTSPSLMASADGTLEALVIALPAFALQGQQNPLWQVYQDLLLKLPEDVKLYILVNCAVRGQLEQWLEEHDLTRRSTLYSVPSHYEPTYWARDEFELVRDTRNGKVYMVQPHTNIKTTDEHVSYHACRQFGWERIKVPLYFEAGNILVGDNFFFLGTDHAVDTFTDLNELVPQTSNFSSGKVLAEPFQRHLDLERTLFFIGSALKVPAEQKRPFWKEGKEWTEIIYQKNREGTAQPISQISMFLTLAGRNKEGKYRVLVGDPYRASELLNNRYDILATPEVFDNIAETLTRLGFEVIRNPLPLVYVDDEERRVRKWYYASYNNVLVQIAGDNEKTVWLPSYGHGNWQELEATDRENAAIWQKLGFKVIMLGDCHPFAAHSGTIQLIKQYIRRRA